MGIYLVRFLQFHNKSSDYNIRIMLMVRSTTESSMNRIATAIHLPHDVNSAVSGVSEPLSMVLELRCYIRKRFRGPAPAPDKKSERFMCQSFRVPQLFLCRYQIGEKYSSRGHLSLASLFHKLKNHMP